MKTYIGETAAGPRKLASNAVKLALLASTPLVLGTNVTFAQEPVEEGSIEEIITTGSRVTNPNLEQASQILVMSEQEIITRQVLDAESLVGELPGIAPGTSRSINNGSNGTASLNLRGLGDNRNLILLDGQRMTPTDLSARTDLNNIPMVLIERVDIVTGGASSVYGADAVAGVTNFITKRDFSGAQIALSASETMEGDGQTGRVDITIGGNFEGGRGNAVLNIGYQDVDGITQGERKFSEVATYGAAPQGSGTSVPTRINQQMYDPATGGVQPSTTFNFAPFNYFQSPTERYNVFGKAFYEVSDKAEVYSSAMYSRNSVKLQLAPSGMFGDTWNMPLNNPFLPDDFRNLICDNPLNAIPTATCDAAGAAVDSNDPNYLEVPVVVNRRLVEQGNRETEYLTDMFQLTVGTKGDITDNIQFDVYAQYGESTRAQTNVHWGLKSRLQETLRATDEFTCDPTTNPGIGCSPINLFGDGMDISPETIAYWDQQNGTTVKTSLAAAVAAVSGEFNGWTDYPIGWAAGLEWREYKASQNADVASSTQDEVLGTGAPDPLFGGQFDVSEAFLETIIPIIGGVTLEAGIRLSDYSTTGKGETYKLGGTWQINDAIKIRGIFQESARSPNIFELFNPPVTGLNNKTFDPCQGFLADGVTPNPALANPDVLTICGDQGAPAGAAAAGLIPEPSAGQINETSGGNDQLDVETAESTTFGMVFTPSNGLMISVDYYNIKIDDAITTPTSGDIFDPCFGSGVGGDNFGDANPNSPACNFLARNPLNGGLNGGGDTPGMITQLSNQGTLESSGIDFRISYNWELGGAIEYFDFDLVGNYTEDLLFQASPTSINRECTGQYSPNCDPSLPELSANFRTTMGLGDWGNVSLLWRFQDEMSWEKIESNPFDGSPNDGQGMWAEYLTMDAAHYFDLSWTLAFGSDNKYSVSLLVVNILDEDPPITGSFIGGTGWNSGNTYPSNYDVLGTRWSLTGIARF